MKNNLLLTAYEIESTNQQMNKMLLAKQPVRVLIADDHPRSRTGLRALLATSPLVKVVGEAANGQEAVSLVETYQPDVVVMDAQMPVMDGLEASRRIKQEQPQAKIVMLTVYNTRRAEAAAAGIDVFLSKGCTVETLLSAILAH